MEVKAVLALKPMATSIYVGRIRLVVLRLWN